MPVHQGDIFKKLERARVAIKRIPTVVGAVAKNFFLAGFDKQGWQGDGGLVAWPPRKDSRNDRPILIGKGNLRKSLYKVVQGPYVAVKVSGVASKYADVHNFGFKGAVSVTSRKGNTFTREMNVPQRQFIGQTKAIEPPIRKAIEEEIRKINF